MNQPELTSLVRSPSGAVAIGLLSALILGSLATAGMNTLWVARVMIGISAMIVSTYVFASSLTANWASRKKVLVLACALAVHLAIERAETWAQPLPPSPRGMPMPPLMLMLRPGKLGYSHPTVQAPGIPLALSFVERPTGGFAGFGEAGDNKGDDVMLGIRGVALRNLSDKPLRLSWTLTVIGEGKRFELNGSGRGRWERQLNLNDFLAATKGPRLSWLLSPLELRPHESTPITSAIGFVAPQADVEIRALILKGDLPAEYSAMLAIKDEDSGVVARLPLPFGLPPAPANDPVSRELRRATEGE